MKVLTVFCSILLLVSYSSDTKTQTEEICIESDWATMELNGEVKRLEDHWHTNPDSLDEGWLDIYEFDKDGYLTYKSFSIDGILQRESKIIRNDKKEIIRVENRNHISDKKYKQYYTYENCNVVDITGFQPDEANRFDRRKFKYDSLGKVTEVKEFLDGDLMETRLKIYKEDGSYETKLYNMNNRLRHRYIYQTTSDPGKIYSVNMNYWAEDDTSEINDLDSTFFEYDKHGNTTQRVTYVGGKPYIRKFFYTYDSLDNWVRYEDHQDSALWHIYTRKFVFY